MFSFFFFINKIIIITEREIENGNARAEEAAGGGFDEEIRVEDSTPGEAKGGGDRESGEQDGGATEFLQKDGDGEHDVAEGGEGERGDDRVAERVDPTAEGVGGERGGGRRVLLRRGRRREKEEREDGVQMLQFAELVRRHVALPASLLLQRLRGFSRFLPCLYHA